MDNQVARNRFSFQVYETPQPLEADWRALDAAPECSIHQTYDWCRFWIEMTKCRALIIVAAFDEGAHKGKIAFILPLAVHSHGPVKIARYMSAPFNNINFGVYSSEFLEFADPATMTDIRRQMAAENFGAYTLN